MMTVSEVSDLLRCDVFTPGCPMDAHIEYGCASDLMSDVLAFSRAGAVLLTGLANPQTLQTAFIAEITMVVLVRGKRPSAEVIAAARRQNVPLLGTAYSMYEACGILYKKGLPSTMEFGEGVAPHEKTVKNG